MTSTARIDTLSDAAGTGPTTLTKQSAAKSWGYIANGAEVTSFNVSSVDDNGIGDYDANFTNNMSQSNFPATTSVRVTSSNNFLAYVNSVSASDVQFSTASDDGDGTNTADEIDLGFNVHGDLA